MRIRFDTDMCPVVIPDTYNTQFQFAVADDMWEQFVRMLREKAIPYIEQAFEDVGSIASISELQSPREYNWRTDWFDINIDMEDIEKLVSDISAGADDTFFRYTEENFGSHPGFISLYPIGKERFIKALDDMLKHPDAPDYRKRFALALSMWVMWNTPFHKGFQEAYLEDVMQEIGDYLDEEVMA